MGSDLQLSVGVPLISGLTIQQLAGILAHEFGHFRQGSGMRLYYIIETVNGWFAQCVYGGSWVEDKLDEASEIQSGQVYFLSLACQLFIWLTRWVMWLFMMFGTAISYFLSRQMEYDADQCEIQLAGSRNFESTTYAFEAISKAFGQTFYMSLISWKKRVLVNDLPALIKMEAKELLSQKKEEIVNSIQTANTRLWDTHPSWRDRIAQAWRLNLPGICRMEDKSRTLFTDYSLLCRELTWTFFEKYFETGEIEKKILNVNEYREFLRQQDPIPENRQIAL